MVRNEQDQNKEEGKYYENHFPVFEDGAAESNAGIEDDGRYNCGQSFKESPNKQDGMKFEIYCGKNQECDKCEENKSYCRCKRPPDSPHPIPDVSDYLDHGGLRDQLAKGTPLINSPFFTQPYRFTADSLF
jgi:hypothetical protein